MGIDVCFSTHAGMPMSDQDQLRNRGARLIAMALNARNEGHLDYPARFTQRASEIVNHPTALERLGTQGRSHPLAVRFRLQHREAG